MQVTSLQCLSICFIRVINPSPFYQLLSKLFKFTLGMEHSIGFYVLYVYFYFTLVAAPRVWYFHDFQYFPRRIYLLRGGKVLKVE